MVSGRRFVGPRSKAASTNLKRVPDRGCGGARGANQAPTRYRRPIVSRVAHHDRRRSARVRDTDLIYPGATEQWSHGLFTVCIAPMSLKRPTYMAGTGWLRWILVGWVPQWSLYLPQRRECPVIRSPGRA